MSLVCHTIVSRYTPQQRDSVITPGEIDADPWETENSFGRTQHLHSRPAPLFVPASLEYDEYGMPKKADVVQPQTVKSHNSSRDVSTWYRGLTAGSSAKVETQISTVNCPSLAAPTPHASPHSPADSRHLHIEDNLPTQGHNWFTSCSSRTPATHVSKPNTLADLLSRNPPPLPSEPAFNPPIFLAIGPSNKGFTMLQRKGWQEGEGLGSARVERKSNNGLDFPKAFETVFQERNAKQYKSVPRPFEAHVKPLPKDVRHEVIDLTLSDSESEQDSPREVVDLTLSDSELDNDGIERPEDTSPDSTSHGTTLLTPIATTLKADRLGIGLKLSRNSSTKAVTHTSVALAAHICSANQARVDRDRYGRGSRGFARARRKEEQERIGLLAYMKS